MHGASRVAHPKRMFKKRTSKNKTSKRTRTADDAGDDEKERPKSTLLSFDAGDEGPVFKVKKKKLRKAPRPRAPSEETKDPAPSTSLYSAEGLAALRASQKALPAELAAEAARIAEDEAAAVAAAEEEAADAERQTSDARRDDARAKAARVERATARGLQDELERTAHVEDFDVRNDDDDDSDDGHGAPVARAEDFVPLPGGAGKVARERDEERRRWLRAGADAGDVDAPAAEGGAMDAALEVAGEADDDDEALAAHEREIMRRGASTAAVAGAPKFAPAPPQHKAATYDDVFVSVKKRLDDLEGDGAPAEWLPRKRLRDAAAHAAAEAERAERLVAARLAAVDAHDRALAAAYADKAHAALAASRLRAAAGLVAAAADACERARAAAAAVDPSLPPPPPGAPPLHALTAPYDPDAAHFAALRAAMRDAVALVADHEPDGGGGFSVYAAGAAG